jgi:hypothetical protein
MLNNAGASIILSTCSSLYRLLITRYANNKIVNINSLMLKKALKKYKRIATLATVKISSQSVNLEIKQLAKSRGQHNLFIHNLQNYNYLTEDINNDKILNKDALYADYKTLKIQPEALILTQLSLYPYLEDISNIFKIPVFSAPKYVLADCKIRLKNKWRNNANS